jgi:hypothetical protein
MHMPGVDGPGPVFGTFPPTSMPLQQPPLPRHSFVGDPNARPPPPPEHGFTGDPQAQSLSPPQQGPSRGPPPPPPAMGLGQTDDASALLINTCTPLELPFLDYIAKEAKSQFWQCVHFSLLNFGLLLLDHPL